MRNYFRGKWEKRLLGEETTSEDDRGKNCWKKEIVDTPFIKWLENGK
jgi:hypothetical protein